MGKETLNYHEGLSINQCKIILRLFGLEFEDFNSEMFGRTRIIVNTRNRREDITQEEGIYEYDLIGWIRCKVEGRKKDKEDEE